MPSRSVAAASFPIASETCPMLRRPSAVDAARGSSGRTGDAGSGRAGRPSSPRRSCHWCFPRVLDALRPGHFAEVVPLHLGSLSPLHDLPLGVRVVSEGSGSVAVLARSLEAHRDRVTDRDLDTTRSSAATPERAGAFPVDEHPPDALVAFVREVDSSLRAVLAAAGDPPDDGRATRVPEDPLLPHAGRRRARRQDDKGAADCGEYCDHSSSSSLHLSPRRSESSTGSVGRDELGDALEKGAVLLAERGRLVRVDVDLAHHAALV